MNDLVYVPMQLDLYKEILNRFPDSPHTLIQNVVGDFLDRTNVEDEKNKQNGIFWGKVFLPDGTKIRTKYFHQILEGEIKNDKVFWRDKIYNSISQLINSMRGNTMNNAWHFAEIKRPNDIDWVLADTLRKRKFN